MGGNGPNNSGRVTTQQFYEALLENKYLVRCAFESEEQGMEFLVMIKETDELDLEIGGKAPSSMEEDELELEIGDELVLPE